MVLKALAPVDLLPLVARSAAGAEPRCAGRGVTLDNGCRTAARVLADGDALQRLLAELLAAAADCADEGSILRLAQEAAADDRVRLSLSVPDATPPVLQAWLARFGPAAEAAGADVGGDAHGAPPAFWIELRSAPASPDPAEAAPSQPTASVLYVEDNPSNRRLVATVLRKAPEWRLLTAADGVYGLAEARRVRPDVILTDINIPGLDGYQLLRELRRLPETAAIPVIAISAEALPEDVERARAAGFHGYLCKPFLPGDLLDAVRAALRTAGAAKGC